MYQGERQNEHRTSKITDAKCGLHEEDIIIRAEQYAL